MLLKFKLPCPHCWAWKQWHGRLAFGWAGWGVSCWPGGICELRLAISRPVPRVVDGDEVDSYQQTGRRRP